MNCGNLPLPQLNLPESTMYPPIEVPWPPTYLVAEAAITSAPCSKGLTKPTPIVLSTINGISWLWAISAKASKSGTSSFGLPIDSQ